MSEFERLYDMVALHSLQVEAVVTLIRSLAREHVDGQVSWGYLIVAHDNGMLDGIHHLAHISRPGIGEENIVSFSGN